MFMPAILTIGSGFVHNSTLFEDIRVFQIAIRSPHPFWHCVSSPEFNYKVVIGVPWYATTLLCLSCPLTQRYFGVLLLCLCTLFFEAFLFLITREGQSPRVIFFAWIVRVGKVGSCFSPLWLLHMIRCNYLAICKCPTSHYLYAHQLLLSLAYVHHKHVPQSYYC